jgi:Predicted phosphatase homologous to the C-terminal domain of histone macroH2A1
MKHTPGYDYIYGVIFMTKEEKVSRLIQYLKNENRSYDTLAEPVDSVGKRRLLRSLMNVRFPGPALNGYMELQDELLTEEAQEKGLVKVEELPTAAEEFGIGQVRNADRMSLWRGDITRLQADAIVNAANSQLLGCFVPCHGCIDNAIHSAAGIQLRNACAELMEEQGHEEPTGKAKITPGYNLPAAHVIHTVGPIVGLKVTEKQKEELKSCYVSCLKLAEKEGLKNIVFCCISTGEFHFPNKLAAEIAVDTADRFLTGSKLERVVFNVFKEEDYNIYKKLFKKALL